MPRSKITSAQRREVVRLIKAGQTLPQVATAVGLHRTTVYNIAKAAGVRSRNTSRGSAGSRRWANPATAPPAGKVWQ